MQRHTRRTLDILAAAAAAAVALGCEGVVLPVGDVVGGGAGWDTPSNDSEGAPGAEPRIPDPSNDSEASPDDVTVIVEPPAQGEAPPPATGDDPTVAEGPQPYAGPCVIRSFSDDPMDTQARALVEFAYDDKGRVTDEWQDADANGEPDRHDVRTFDAEGRLTSLAIDFGFDDTIDAVTLYTWEEGKRSRTLEDRDNDGIFDAITSTQYAQGRPWFREEDADADGAPETRRTFAFDGEGRLAFEIAADLVGTRANDTVTYRYDADNGRLVAIETDVGSDGALDAQILYTWTPEGRTESETIEQFPAPEDTQAVRIIQRTTWSHDDIGNVTEALIETDDSREVRVQRYDYGCWE